MNAGEVLAADRTVPPGLEWTAYHAGGTCYAAAYADGRLLHVEENGRVWVAGVLGAQEILDKTDRLAQRLSKILPDELPVLPSHQRLLVKAAEGRPTLSALEISSFEVPDVDTLPFLGREGLIMAGGTNLLYSYPKVGKTEILTALVADWSDADMDVLYLTEEGFPNWRRRLAVHECLNTKLRVHYAFGYSVAEALRIVEDEHFDVLVADTIRYTLGYQEGEGDKDVARVLVPFFRAAAGRTVVCSYHARKMPGEGGRDISGHHALYGAFDRALQLTPVDGRDQNRRVVASGRCMYDGDATFEYHQLEAGRFEALDGTAVVTPKKRASYTLTCLGCGENFTARRRDARFCSDGCQKHSRRNDQLTQREIDVSEITEIPLESAVISDIKLDGEWL